MLLGTTVATSGAPLEDLRWSWRGVLAYAAPDSEEARLLQRELAALSCPIVERDLAVYRVHRTNVEALTPGAPVLDPGAVGELRSPAGGFDMVLIGKDGRVKARAATADALPDFLTLIDGMPMRRRETAQRGSRCGE